MRVPAIPPDAPADEYLDRLSAALGVDRSRVIVSAPAPGVHEHQAPERRRKRASSLMRQTTAACTMAALGSCLFLYWGKSQAALADREIGRVLRATQEARARVSTLRAEWALLNQPDRLRDMADHHLQLRPVAPEQFCEAAKLGGRMPPVSSPADGNDEADTALASADTPAPPDAKPPLEPVPPAPPAAAERVAEAVPPASQAPAEPVAHGTIPHAPAKAMPAPKYLTPVIAEARQPVRVRDSGEALLNGDPEPARIHTRIVRAGVFRALASLPRPDPGLRPAHRFPAPKIDLPRWLMQAHLVRPGRSEPPHALAPPQGSTIPLAPQPEAAPETATTQRIAKPAPEHPPLLEAAPPEAEAQASIEPDETPRYRPAYRRNYAYGNPYRPYWGRPYGGYPNPYGNGYANPYFRGYPPPQPGPYYQ